MGVLTVLLRIAQLPILAVMLYFVAWQGTMLAKEMRYIKLTPEWIKTPMHCNYIEEYGKTYVGSKWETKHPYLGCHPKKGYTVKDLQKSVPPLKWTPTDLAKMAERNSPYSVQDIFALFMDRGQLA